MKRTIMVFLSLALLLTIGIVPALASEEDYQAEAQAFAEKFFTESARCFDKPLSIRLTNAWYYRTSWGDYKFTFQFDVANKIGIVNNVFYGNQVSLALTEENVSQAYELFQILGDPMAWFVENEIEAMQMGEPLDAAAIQSYFFKHY